MCRACLLSFVVIVGCGSAESPTAPPPVTATPAPSAPVPVPVSAPAAPTEAAPPAAVPAAAPPTAAVPAEGGPEAAYAAMREAFNRGDDAAYFGGMGATFVCYFGRADVPRSEVETARRPLLAAVRAAEEPQSHPHIESMEVRRVRETADEIELVDFGWTGRGGYDAETVFHQKRLLFRRDGTTWRLVGEGPASGGACGLPAIDATPPERWRRLRDQFRSFVEGCEGPPGMDPERAMEEGYPGIGGSNGCMTEMNITPATLCEGHYEAACVTQAVADLNTFIQEDFFDLANELEVMAAE